MIYEQFGAEGSPAHPAIRTRFNGLGTLDEQGNTVIYNAQTKQWEITKYASTATPAFPGYNGSGPVKNGNGNGDDNGMTVGERIGDFFTGILKPTAEFIKETGFKPGQFIPGAGPTSGPGSVIVKQGFPWGPVILGVGTVAVIATLARAYASPKKNPGLPKLGPLGWGALGVGSLYLLSMRKRATAGPVYAPAAQPAYGKVTDDGFRMDLPAQGTTMPGTNLPSQYAATESNGKTNGSQDS